MNENFPEALLDFSDIRVDGACVDCDQLGDIFMFNIVIEVYSPDFSCSDDIYK